MEIFQFEQFQMIAQCGTMREAAERLFLSQPTLSHNIKKLEAELGCKLFISEHAQLCGALGAALFALEAAQATRP